jgi:acyl CoA:acetate/3-ketoacid CoA transferase alpha subunit
MLQKRQISKMNASYVGKAQYEYISIKILGENKVYESQYLNGEIELNLIPQGSLAEKLRSGSAGIRGFFVPAGVETVVENGGLPMKYKLGGKEIEKHSKPKETREFNGRKYVFEESIAIDFSIVKVIIPNPNFN